MGNSEGRVVVVNKHSERLKVRVDCNRYITFFKVDASFKGYGISHQEEIKPTYIVDTSDSFAWVDGNDKRTYATKGGMCYISIADENDEGAAVTVAGSTEEYYRVDTSQGITKIGSGRKTIFFVNGLNNVVFVSINSEKLSKPLCNNFAVTLKKIHRQSLFHDFISGPKLIVENDPKNVAKFINKRFYHSEVKAADEVAVKCSIPWESFDDE